MQQENKYIQSLKQGAKFGNSAALERLFEMNLSRIFTLALRLTGNVTEAEHLCARVFVSASDKITNIADEVPFSRWIAGLTITTLFKEPGNNNNKKKHWLKRKREDETEEIDTTILEPIQNVLAELQREERIAFVLNKIEKLPPDKIAALIGLTEKETESKINTALKKILKSGFNGSTEEELQKEIAGLPKEIKLKSNTQEEIFNEIYKIKTERANKLEEKLEEKRRQEAVEKTPEKEKKTKTEKYERSPAEKQALKNRIYFIGSFAVFVAVVIYLITSSSTSWNVSAVTGTTKIGDDIVKGAAGFAPGDAMETFGESYARIEVPDIGTIDVNPFTVLTNVDKKNTLEIKKGSITANFQNSKNIFHFIIPSANVSDFNLNSSYSITVSDEGISEISVSAGWVDVESDNAEVIIPKYYKVEVSKGKGCGIPFHFSADQEFIDLINELAFRSRETILSQIVKRASLKDAVTLWNIFSRVDHEYRKLVYKKLNELVPHPENIEEEKFLQLDEESMLKWLQEIEWLL